MKRMDIIGFINFRVATWAFAFFDQRNISYINKFDIKKGLKEYISPFPFSDFHLEAMDKVYLS